jgi:hypothetical protein
VELATGSDSGHAHEPHCNISYGHAQPPQTEDIWGGYAKEGEVEGLRYIISVSGHRKSTYPILEGNNLQKRFDQLFSRLSGGVDDAFVGFSEEMEKAMLPVKALSY